VEKRGTTAMAFDDHVRARYAELPAEAFGASGPAQAGTVVAAQTHGSVADEVPHTRG
jgi:hypothetical protein